MSILRCLIFNLKVHIIIPQVQLLRGEFMHDSSLTEIGKRIQSCRKQRGYTQEQLADRMNVSIQMVSNLERGNKAIRIENLINLSKILDVSTDYILTGKETANDVQALTARIAQLPEKDRNMINLLVDYCLTENP